MISPTAPARCFKEKDPTGCSSGFCFSESLESSERTALAQSLGVWMAWPLFRIEGTLHGLSGLAAAIFQKNWL